jgi:DNA-binding response OmpR family regulator
MVRTAASGHEALEKLDADVPDLVVLDIGLPDMSGWEVLEQIRAGAAGHDCKVLVLSGYDDVQAEGKRLGADAVIVKPFRNDELRAVAVDLAGPHLTEGVVRATV